MFGVSRAAAMVLFFGVCGLGPGVDLLSGLFPGGSQQALIEQVLMRHWV